MYVHAINKQAYDFTCTSESVAKRVQREIEDHMASQINNIISSVLSEHFKTDRHLKIDKIEIDLGDILLNDFGDTGMLDNFKKLLEEEILVAGNAYKTNHYKSAGHDSAVPDKFKQIIDEKFQVADKANGTNYYKHVGHDNATPDGLKKSINRKSLAGGNSNSRGADHYKNIGHDAVVPDRFEKLYNTIPSAGNGNSVSNDTVDTDTGLTDNLENESAIIRLFLMQGDIPWWTDKTADIDFDNMVQKLMRAKPDSLKSFLEEHKDQWQVLWRLAKQYKPATRVMLDALAPGILPASINRKIFEVDDALSGGHPLPHILWVKLKKILNRRASGSIDQLRRNLLNKMVKVVNLLQKNIGVSRNLPGVSILTGTSPGVNQHQSRKKTKERLMSLFRNLSVFQMEFLLFQLTLLPDLSTDAYSTAESMDASDETDLPGYVAGHQEMDNTRQEEPGVVETTRAHAAIHHGDDEQFVKNIHEHPGTAHGAATPAEAPDLLPKEHVSAEPAVPDQDQSDDELIGIVNGESSIVNRQSPIVNGESSIVNVGDQHPALPYRTELQQQNKSSEAFSPPVQHEAAGGNTTAEKITANDNQFSGSDKNSQLLHQKNDDSFIRIAEELALLQLQEFTEAQKRLLFPQNKKDKLSAGKPETSVAKPGNQLQEDRVGEHMLTDLHPKQDKAENDPADTVTVKGRDISITGKTENNILNDEHEPDPSTFRRKHATQDYTTPDATVDRDDTRDSVSFTSPDEDSPATGRIRHIEKQSDQTGLNNPFASAWKDQFTSAQTPASNSNRVNGKIAFIMKRLNTTEAVFFEYLNHLQESELNRLEEMLKKHIRQKSQRRKKIKAILEHPHFFKFNVLKIFANLYFDKEQEKEGPVDPDKIAANRKSRITAVAEKIQWSQSAFLFFTDKLPVKQVVILQDIFEKQQCNSGDEKKVVQKILGKISEEGLLLIEFLTELPETEIREVLQISKNSLADRTSGNQAPAFFRGNETFKIYIENAGLCLIANYLRGLFKRLDYLENGLFKTKAVAARAIFLLQYMVTGKKKCPEHILQLNKLLCGFKTDDCIIPGIRLTKKEVEEADDLIQSVIENWKALKNTSLNGFRESFLQRKGILFENESYWTLQVEKKGYDLLLDTIPWGFRMIKMPWVKKYMQVEW